MATALKNNTKEKPEEVVTEEVVAEEVVAEELDNDSLVTVTNTMANKQHGIGPGQSGQIKYGLFKSTIGLDLE